MYFKYLIKNKVISTPHGFTIIEVVIALCILSFGILAVANMQISSIKGNSSARKRTEAATLAMEYMERVISKDYNSLTNENLTSNNYVIQCTVTPDSPVSGVKSVLVKVSWPDNGQNRSTELRYIKANL